ncbi:MAG: N-acetylmuramoyl-L-alanine amidase [Deltaproteobacteria bacterium CG_4_9_14_3_um_filter_65_9]|nr:MAG: N-acetylmuramoyl-L-alanine amidase [Deltaproteobacteria bacterium CG_4_9_14_3_um_filter_65_9]
MEGEAGERGDVTFLRRHLGATIAVFLCAAGLPLVAPPAVAAATAVSQVSDIRAWTNEIYTRVAIDTRDEVSWQANTLRADPLHGLPPRIFIDIQGAGIRDEILHKPIEVRNGLLRQVRAGRFDSDTVRVVIDLERESTYRVFALPGPFRIIVDIDGEGEIPALPAPPPASLAIPPNAAHPAPVPMSRVRVMIDPGHGGKDSGAIGPTGLKEKDVVLAIGRKIREKLSRSGEFDVRMTRDEDVFIPLEERTAMANKGRVDLFVSIHINASRNRKAGGYTTYVLSRGASNREDLELAARENGVPVRKLQGVKFIIDDMFTGARKNESLRLAKTVNDAVVRHVSTRYPGTQSLGLKQAPFYVLVGARMTAVLVEASFISNAREEARLRDPSCLDGIADGVVEAIRYYGQNGILAHSDF